MTKVVRVCGGPEGARQRRSLGYGSYERLRQADDDLVRMAHVVLHVDVVPECREDIAKGLPEQGDFLIFLIFGPLPFFPDLFCFCFAPFLPCCLFGFLPVFPLFRTSLLFFFAVSGKKGETSLGRPLCETLIEYRLGGDHSIGRTPKGVYSPRGRTRHLLEPPSQNPF